MWYIYGAISSASFLVKFIIQDFVVHSGSRSIQIAKIVSNLSTVCRARTVRYERAGFPNLWCSKNSGPVDLCHPPPQTSTDILQWLIARRDREGSHVEEDHPRFVNGPDEGND